MIKPHMGNIAEIQVVISTHQSVAVLVYNTVIVC